MKNIGILGSGIVAQTLGNGFLKHGYEVMLGTRNITKLNEWVSKSGDKGKTGSFSDAAKFGDLIVLAVKGMAAHEVLNLAGADNLEGKTVIDTTNPIDTNAMPEDGVIKYFTKQNESLMESLLPLAPNANFVKAFCQAGNVTMVNPHYSGIKPTMFICGNDDSAKKQAVQILAQFGWEAEDIGTSKAAGAIENLAILWCVPAFRKNLYTHAFKLLK